MRILPAPFFAGRAKRGHYMVVSAAFSSPVARKRMAPAFGRSIQRPRVTDRTTPAATLTYDPHHDSFALGGHWGLSANLVNSFWASRAIMWRGLVGKAWG